LEKMRAIPQSISRDRCAKGRKLHDQQPLLGIVRSWDTARELAEDIAAMQTSTALRRLQSILSLAAHLTQ